MHYNIPMIEFAIPYEATSEIEKAAKKKEDDELAAAASLARDSSSNILL